MIKHKEKDRLTTKVVPKVQEKESPRNEKIKARERIKASGTKAGIKSNSQPFVLLSQTPRRHVGLGQRTLVARKVTSAKCITTRRAKIEAKTVTHARGAKIVYSHTTEWMDTL